MIYFLTLGKILDESICEWWFHQNKAGLSKIYPDIFFTESYNEKIVGFIFSG